MCKFSTLMCVAIAMVAMLTIGLQLVSCSEKKGKMDLREGLYLEPRCNFVENPKPQDETKYSTYDWAKLVRKDARKECAGCCVNEGYKYGGLYRDARKLQCNCGYSLVVKWLGD